MDELQLAAAAAAALELLECRGLRKDVRKGDGGLLRLPAAPAAAAGVPRGLPLRPSGASGRGDKDTDRSVSKEQ